MRVVVTRPAAQAADWLRRLRELGVDAVALPLIDIGPADDPAPLRAAWQRLDRHALVMFVSANAVRHFFAAAPAGARWPDGVRAGSTGPGTSKALREAGVADAAIAEPAPDAPSFDSEALWQRLAGLDWSGREVLVVRGEDGRDWLADTLRARGADVAFVAAYRRCAPTLDAAGRATLQQALREPARHCWLFSSSQAIDHLRQLAPQADWSGAQALATHPRIAARARAAGFGSVREVAPNAQAVAAAADGPSIQSAAP